MGKLTALILGLAAISLVAVFLFGGIGVLALGAKNIWKRLLHKDEPPTQ